MDRITAVLFFLNVVAWVWFLSIRIIEERQRFRVTHKLKIEKVRRIKKIRELSGGL